MLLQLQEKNRGNMNKSILKICLPSATKVLPVYLNNDVSAWHYESGSLIVNLRAVITDYPHMTSDLSDIARTTGTSLVPNGTFSFPRAGEYEVPHYWNGDWFDKYATMTPEKPMGFYWDYFPPIGNSKKQWEVATGVSALISVPPTSLGFTYIFSSPFDIISGSEYSTSIRFMSDNGYWNIGKYDRLPNKEDSYGVTIQGVETIVNVGEENYKYLPTNPRAYTLEADYGAIIVYTNSGSTFSELIAFGRGRTSNEINPYDTETYIPQANPIWKNYKSSFVPEGTGTSSARLYIYNRHVQRPSNSKTTGWRRPWVSVDYAVVVPSVPYITQDMGSNSAPIQMDSYSYFEADSPSVKSQIKNIEFYANWITSTGCALTITSGSMTTTTYGFHRPGVDVGNNSYTLKFGKDEGETAWASHITFPGSPLNALTEGVRISSAFLTFTATKDIISTPSKTCYIATGMEDTDYNTSPANPANYSNIVNKPIAGQLNTTLLESWVQGEEYTIDITNSVKEQLGRKAISWGTTGNLAAIVKNNNSTIGGYREIASGSHLGYSGPKLTINYVGNGYPKNVIGTFIQEVNPLSNYYRYTTMHVGGAQSKGNRSRALLYFNLGSLPSGNIEEAQIVLRAYNASYAGGTHTFNAHTINGGGTGNTVKWDWYGVSWQKRFGAGSTAATGWAGGDWDTNVSATVSNVVNPPSGGTNVLMPFNTYGLTRLNSMKNGTVKNHGFLIKDSSETSDTRIMFISGNHTSAEARPYLKVRIGTKWYEIKNWGPSEDPSGGGDTPPTPPTPPAPSSSITMVKQQWSETGSNGATINYSLSGEINSNRYILVSEGWNDNNSQWGYDAHFNTLTFNGISATPIVTVRSDESNLTMWGVVIPNNIPANTNIIITGTKVAAVGGGRRSVSLHIREFTHVNQTSPVYTTTKNHNGANSAIECVPGGLAINYLARGWVADAVFLANDSSELGVPRVGFTHQVRDNSVLRYGFSHFTPGTNNGSIAFNWTWNRQGGDYASSGSDNALGIVSLRPE